MAIMKFYPNFENKKDQRESCYVSGNICYIPEFSDYFNLGDFKDYDVKTC